MNINHITESVVEYVDHQGSDLMIARAAWVSTGADQREFEEGRIEGLLGYLMKHRHGSVFEHTSLTVRVSAPIMVFREWHRHRVQSFNEMSGRYTEFQPEFYVPPKHRPLINIGTSARPRMAPADAELHDWFVEDLIAGYEQAWERYQEALERGISNEMARLHLPVGVISNMYATANLRGWMHFLSLRTSHEHATIQGHPQWEIEQAALQVEKILREKFPLSMKKWDENGRVAP